MTFIYGVLLFTCIRFSLCFFFSARRQTENLPLTSQEWHKLIYKYSFELHMKKIFFIKWRNNWRKWLYVFGISTIILFLIFSKCMRLFVNSKICFWIFVFIYLFIFPFLFRIQTSFSASYVSTQRKVEFIEGNEVK